MAYRLVRRREFRHLGLFLLFVLFVVGLMLLLSPLDATSRRDPTDPPAGLPSPFPYPGLAPRPLITAAPSTQATIRAGRFDVLSRDPSAPMPDPATNPAGYSVAALAEPFGIDLDPTELACLGDVDQRVRGDGGWVDAADPAHAAVVRCLAAGKVLAIGAWLRAERELADAADPVWHCVVAQLDAAATGLAPDGYDAIVGACRGATAP